MIDSHETEGNHAPALPQEAFQDWERWFTLRGLYLDSPAVAASKYRELHDHATLADLDVVWGWAQGKRGLDSPETYFLSKLDKDGFVRLTAKVRMFQSEGKKPAQRNINPNYSDHEIEQRDEWIAAVIQERRTVEWVMRAEKMFRAEVIAVLMRLAPYVVTEEMYVGPESPWELPPEIKENWRRHDEAEVIKAERVKLFKAAAARKFAWRQRQGQPLPGETIDVYDPASPEGYKPVPVTPEELSPSDFEVGS